MNKGYFVTGTDTGVGKTFVAAGLIRAMKEQGINVCPMKPVETGCRVRRGQLVPEDTLKLIKASGTDEPIDTINPYRLRNPLAPSIAAGQEGVQIEKRKILNAFKKLAGKYDVIIAEGAGGIMVPLYGTYLFLDLIMDLGLPIIIIARPGLGTINHSLLTVEAARRKGIDVAGFIINHAVKIHRDISHKTNPDAISCLGRVPVIGNIPHLMRPENVTAHKVFNRIAGQLM